MLFGPSSATTADNGQRETVAARHPVAGRGETETGTCDIEPVEIGFRSNRRSGEQRARYWSAGGRGPVAEWPCGNEEHRQERQRRFIISATATDVTGSSRRNEGRRRRNWPTDWLGRWPSVGWMALSQVSVGSEEASKTPPTSNLPRKKKTRKTRRLKKSTGGDGLTNAVNSGRGGGRVGGASR